MGMMEYNNDRKLQLTALGFYLTEDYPSSMAGYLGLEKDDPAVLKLTEWLLNDGPKKSGIGFSYIKDEFSASPMDDRETALFYTMALAGRARILSPVVAAKMTRRAGHLLDVAGGTGYYTYEWLMANPDSQATIMDRPEVLKIAETLLDEYCKNALQETITLKDRVRFLPGDMLQDELPPADLLLAASVFHDWPVEVCDKLADKFSAALKPGGELWIHDSFLDDTHDGPLEVTHYSAVLFLGTKGRAYSRKEMRGWLSRAGLNPTPHNISTGLDYGLIYAIKPSN
jgi:hypothetical protein